MVPHTPPFGALRGASDDKDREESVFSVLTDAFSSLTAAVPIRVSSWYAFMFLSVFECNVGDIFRRYL